MKISSQQYAEALFDAAGQTAPKDRDKLVDNFLKILTQNGDLAKHSEIEEAYELLEMKQHGISQVQITVAKEMEINSNLVASLNKIVGGKVEIKKQINEGILGGVVIRVDDTLIDASVKKQLNNLNKQLKS